MWREDEIRIRHMLDAAREAIAFADGRIRQDLDMLTELPWQDIVGMRNRVVHAYFDIDLDRVWDTVKIDLPALVRLLEKHTPAW